MLATFMVILDTSIVVVALPYIAGNLGATQDESTWVLTSYLVANAVILPASAWFSSFFGRKRFLIACTVVVHRGFVDLRCGDQHADAGRLARVLQGLGGGAMQPLVPGHPAGKFSAHPTRRGHGLVRLAIVVAPVVGPTLGGWLTDQLVLALDFLHQSARGHPCGFFDAAGWWKTRLTFAPSRPGRIDGIGFGLMGLFLGTLQIILDKGQDADWFSAVWLRWFAVICAASFIGFIVRELGLQKSASWICTVFKNRNFAVSCALFALFGMALYALITLQPLFLQSLLGYTAFDAGLSVSSARRRTLGRAVFCRRARGQGRFANAGGTWFRGGGAGQFSLSRLSLQMSDSSIVVLPNIIAGFGIAAFSCR